MSAKHRNNSVFTTQYSAEVKIGEPVNALLSEGIHTDSRGRYYLFEHSPVYSGITGRLLFVAKSKLKFPFASDVLRRSINNISLIFGPGGAYETDGVDFRGAEIQFSKAIRQNA